jgi:hypothetical protein
MLIQVCLAPLLLRGFECEDRVRAGQGDGRDLSVPVVEAGLRDDVAAAVIARTGITMGCPASS